MGYWGGMWYDPPGSSRNILHDQEHIVTVGPYCVASQGSMLMLGGLGACPPPPQKNRCSEIESEGISESKYYIM